VYRFIVASPSRRTTNRPWKGSGYVTWHVLNFGGPIHISGMAEARAVKFCTKGDHIKYCQRDDKSPLKGTWFCSRDPCMRNCGLIKIIHCTRWIAINNVTDDWLLIIAPTALKATLRLMLSSIGSTCHCKYLLQSWLYNIYTTNRLSGVWALSFKYMIIIDLSWYA